MPLEDILSTEQIISCLFNDQEKITSWYEKMSMTRGEFFTRFVFPVCYDVVHKPKIKEVLSNWFEQCSLEDLQQIEKSYVVLLGDMKEDDSILGQMIPLNNLFNMSLLGLHLEPNQAPCLIEVGIFGRILLKV